MSIVTRDVPAMRPWGGERLHATLKNGWGQAIVLCITLRLIYSLFAFGLAQVTPLPTPCDVGKAAPVLYTGVPALGAWQRWDVCWFESIAANGYRADPAAVGFLPFYPFVLRTVSVLLLGNLTLAGLFICTLAYVTAAAGLYQLVRLDFDEATARRAVLYLSIFPSAFYLFVPYAEAVLLALIVWCFLFARRGLWAQAAIFATLAGLTRSPGVLLCLPLAWEVLSHWRKNRRLTPILLVPLLPVISFALYNEYCKAVIGWSYFEGTQATWGGRLIAPWAALDHSWRFTLSTQHAIEAMNLGLLALSMLAILVGLRHLPHSYSIFALAQWLLITSRAQVLTPLMGSNRYLLMAFPIFILMAISFRQPLAHRLWLACSGTLLGGLLWLFLVGAFVA